MSAIGALQTIVFIDRMSRNDVNRTLRIAAMNVAVHRIPVIRRAGEPDAKRPFAKLGQLVEKCFRLPQICGVKSFRKPAVDRF
jgi:hypothetical protein